MSSLTSTGPTVNNRRRSKRLSLIHFLGICYLLYRSLRAKTLETVSVSQREHHQVGCRELPQRAGHAFSLAKGSRTVWHVRVGGPQQGRDRMPRMRAQLGGSGMVA